MDIQNRISGLPNEFTWLKSAFTQQELEFGFLRCGQRACGWIANQELPGWLLSHAGQMLEHLNHTSSTKYVEEKVAFENGDLDVSGCYTASRGAAILDDGALSEEVTHRVALLGLRSIRNADLHHTAHDHKELLSALTERDQLLIDVVLFDVGRLQQFSAAAQREGGEEGNLGEEIQNLQRLGEHTLSDRQHETHRIFDSLLGHT
mmetsp:Transcript_5714/g.17521  ORF Transcript_5714/g.17521 Transcript_5714/m.17521 type:complete len:205 (-) Transcript_5714:1516-2130(-)